MGFFRGEYRAAFTFFLRLRRSFLLILAGFVAAAAVAHAAGGAWYAQKPERMQQALSYVVRLMDAKEILNEEGGISALRLFLGNLQAAGITAALGIVPFLFLPIWILLFNASLIGAVTAALPLVSGAGGAFLFLALLPHGVFELPALALSASMGWMLCRETTARALRRGPSRPFAPLLYEMLRLFMLAVLPLLAAAAAMEAYVTPVLAAGAL